MRKLNTADVFAMCRAVKATGAREELQHIVAQAEKDKEQGKAIDLTEVGVAAFLAIMEAAVEPTAEAMIYKALAGPMECTPEDVATMELGQLIENLKAIAEENDLGGFFDSVSGMIGKT